MTAANEHSDITELRALAEAAPRGRWYWHRPHKYAADELHTRTHVVMAYKRKGMQCAEPLFLTDNWVLREGVENQTARYIAAVSPDVVLGLLDEIESLRVQLNEARSERDAHVDARTQMWVALANIRDACGEGSFFHKQAIAAIGNAEDPDHPVQRAVEARRRLAANVGAARAEVERLRAALAEVREWLCEEPRRPPRLLAHVDRALAGSPSPQPPTECWVCQGSGVMSVATTYTDGTGYAGSVACTACRGSGVAQPTKGDDPVSDDDPYRFRCAHSAYACEDVRARVVELETALRDLANAVQEWDDRGNEVGSAVVRSVAAARRVLGDRPTEETNQ